MYVPPNAPVNVGQPIRLSAGSFNRPEFAGLGDKPLDATIVRVDRTKLPHGGQISVGVKFAV